MKKGSASGVLFLFVLVLSCVFCGTTQAEIVSLTANGTDVVLSPSASPVAKFAATELTNFLGRIFGCPIRVTTFWREERIPIFIGEGPWLKEEGIRTDDLTDDACQIVVRPDRIFIVGRDDSVIDPAERIRHPGYGCHLFPHATLNGVYSFLERYADCRFYFPGRLGEIVPQADSLSVPVSDWIDAPDMTVRTWSFFSDGRWPDEKDARDGNRTKALNLFRLRATGGGFACCHGLNGFKYKERFFRTHPEYFALAADGKRRGVNGAGQDGQLCFSSAVTNEIFLDCLSYLKGEPASVRGIPGEKSGSFSWGRNVTPDRIDVMPQDGMMRCHCAACTAAYGADSDYATTLIWNYTATLAKRLKSEGYEPRLMQMAYPPYRKLPDFRLPTNIVVTVAEKGPFSIRDKTFVGRQLAEIAAWRERVGCEVRLWSYSNKHRSAHLEIPDIPAFCPHAWGRYYKAAAPFIVGGFCESESDRTIYNLLSYYVFARIAWNRSVDAEALIDEFYGRMFGAAAEPMRRFGDILEEKWVSGVCPCPPDDFHLWTDVYDEKTIGELGDCLRSAARAVSASSLEAERIDLFRREMYEPLHRAGESYRNKTSIRRGLDWIARHPDGNLLDWGKKAWGRGRFLAEKGPSGGPVFEIIVPADEKETTSHDVVPFRANANLKPSTRYRLSYFVSFENVVSRELGGGIGPTLHAERKGDEGWKRSFVFPADYRFLSGSSEWVYQVFEFETDDAWDPASVPIFYLRLRHATGTVRFDAMRIDEVGALALP